MKFIADVMLGRLAKRLRLLGYDVLYDPALDDNDIVRLSLEQRRVILTRDATLAARPLASNHLFVRSDHVEEQLEQVLTISPRDASPLTRCSLCNEPLASMTRQEARDLVPPYVFEKNETFQQCTICGRVYWEGTHVWRMIGRAGGKKKRPFRPNGTDRP
ncbi:MAG: Mut7-C RNAse domain-containing protein [Nitrospirota bacterium]|jgi:uncharacterized protein with PIN domain